MAYNPVVWFEMYVQEMGRGKKFYEGVFGLPLTQVGEPDPAQVSKRNLIQVLAQMF